MLTFHLVIVAVLSSLVQCQRGSFAGTRPIGIPELLNKTTTTVDPLGNRFGEGDSTTERLPIEANGDRDLVDRISKWPVDKQPFWYLNWKALEEQRKNPQTYPQRPSQFGETPNFNAANTGTLNSNLGTQNSNLGTQNSNLGTQNSDAGNVNSTSGTLNSTAGTVNPNSGVLSSRFGTQESKSGTLNSAANSNSGAQNSQGLSNSHGVHSVQHVNTGFHATGYGHGHYPHNNMGHK